MSTAIPAASLKAARTIEEKTEMSSLSRTPAKKVVMARAASAGKAKKTVLAEQAKRKSSARILAEKEPRPAKGAIFAATKSSKPAMNIRPGSERQQNHLLGVVYDLISEHGIDAVTMRQVAQASGVSTGTINYHFKNKENLVISALESAYQLPSDWAEYQGSPAAQLQRLALGYAIKVSDSRWWCFWINYLAASTRSEEMRAHQETRFDKQLVFWTDLVAEGMRKGEFKPDLDAQTAACELLIIVHGLLAFQFMKPGAKLRTYAKDRILQAIDTLRLR